MKSLPSSEVNHQDSASASLPNKEGNNNNNNLHVLVPSANSAVLPQVSLKDNRGRIISRKSTSLSQYLEEEQQQPGTTITNQTMVSTKVSTFDNSPEIRDAPRNGREHVINLLKDAGITDMSDSEVLLLPTSQQIKSLYGDGPVILGLETCQAFRERQQQQQQQQRNIPRFIGVSGMFNSGTTAFGLSLQANCRFDNHPRNYTNDKLTDVNGMLDQVPWAKHKNARERQNHTIHDGIPKDNVLPVVLVRDPYYWMQSMCKQGYGARWDHDSNKHCPNLVPNEFDRRRFKRLRQATSVLVWMGASRKEGPHWDSLVHLWNDWYGSYLFDESTTTTSAPFPRLIVRFEDTLFHGKDVMRAVCECAGGKATTSDENNFRYVVDEAKWNHKQAKQNNMVSAMIKYGTDSGRYNNMTKNDLDYAHRQLDSKLMEMFRYKSFGMTQN